ncbi:hypothetical protein IM45_254 [Candidatus Palibaumannia cicadellinicola]|uniref:Uncharacterized protein n=1 Tax=Candidatus Palibaumannia cicadellinicola TaxID=186490 RepID=A0A088N0Y0_9GAMM|nr:hypothetical protein IM45_254 [Candidatus Baumannia cicadellinicola]
MTIYKSINNNKYYVSKVVVAIIYVQDNTNLDMNTKLIYHVLNLRLYSKYFI